MGDRSLKEVCPQLTNPRGTMSSGPGGVPVEQGRIRLTEKGKGLVHVPTEHVQFDRHTGLVATAAHAGHCQPVVLDHGRVAEGGMYVREC
jgi:hypothetical protein